MLKRLDGTPLADTLAGRISEYLNALPDDVVVSSAELAEKMGFLTADAFVKCRGARNTIQHSIKIGAVRYWGSLNTIQRENDAKKSQAS
jgi:hypothetical protein